MKRKLYLLKHSSVWIAAGGLAMAALISCAAQSAPSNLQNAAVLSLLDTSGSSGSRTDMMSGQASSASVSLTRLDLNLSVGPSVTGDVILEIQDAAGVTIGTSTVAGPSLGATHTWNGSDWYTFNFSTAPTVTAGQKYRINFRRTVEHDYNGNNYIFWNSTLPGVVDNYPDGNSAYDRQIPPSIVDFSFIAYTNGTINQQMTTALYGFATGISPIWQEFKVAAPPSPVPPPPRTKVCPRYKFECTDY